MPLASRLRRAYARAHYVVLDTPPVVIRIGRPSTELDAVLAARGAGSAAFITAANPRSRRVGARANALAHRLLKRALARRSRAWLDGEGRDPSARWPAEASVLIVGASRREARAMGRRFRQNAIVYAQRGRPPELLVLA